jgi:O-antigen/teichoic acid export membrane protein
VPLAIGARSATWLVASWIAAALLTSLLTLQRQLHRLGRHHRYRVTGVASYVRRWLRLLLTHHLTAIGGVMIPSLMPTLVVARLSATANAHFYVAWLLSSVLLTVSGAVAGNLLAELSHHPDDVGPRIVAATRLVAILLIPPVVFLTVFGHDVLRLFGSGYAQHSYGILLIFVAVSIPDAVTNVYVTLLRARGLPQRAAAMNVGMGLVALGGAWLLMGPLGVDGAAWAWAGSQGTGCLYVLVDMLRERRHPHPVRSILQLDAPAIADGT